MHTISVWKFVTMDLIHDVTKLKWPLQCGDVKFVWATMSKKKFNDDISAKKEDVEL